LKACDCVSLQAVIGPGNWLVTTCRQAMLWIPRCLSTALDIRGKRKRERHAFSAGHSVGRSWDLEKLVVPWKLVNEQIVFESNWTGLHPLRRLA